MALSAGIAGIASSMTSQLISTGSLNVGSAFEAGAVAAITASLLNGVTYSSADGFGLTATASPQSLANLAGLQTVGSSIVPQAGASTAAGYGVGLLALGASVTIQAGVRTAIEGGSFLKCRYE